MKYKYKKVRDIEANLNKLGRKGWLLVAAYENFLYFVKEAEEEEELDCVILPFEKPVGNVRRLSDLEDHLL